MAFSKIINAFPWSSLKRWENQDTTNRVTLSGNVGQGIIPMYSGDSQNLLLWLIRDTRSYTYDSTYGNLSTLSSATIQITGFPSGNYQITWYESTTGSVLGTGTASGTSMTTSIPSFMRDIVAIIKPQ